MDDAQILSHYNLTTLYPAEWPAEKDEGNISDDESNTTDDKVKNRYTTLERAASVRSSIIGSQKVHDGVETLVQKDESDPLGRGDSVVRLLRQRGMGVEDKPKLSKTSTKNTVSFSADSTC